MGSPGSVVWLLLPAALGIGGCHARLPLPVEEEPVPALAAALPSAEPSTAWAALLDGGGDEGRRAPDAIRIEPDRLRSVVRYNPPPRGFTSVGDFILSIRICAPGED